jgi:hypothetical protein
MMPRLASPGVMMPGQLGPISTVRLPTSLRFTSMVSWTGTPSVMQAITSRLASAASSSASRQAVGGTKTVEAVAPSCSTAS